MTLKSSWVNRGFLREITQGRRAREDERRLEADRKRKAEENRNRQEIAQRKRFDKLVEWWVENEKRRLFLARLRETVGEIPDASPLANWLTWAEDYIEMADPLARFRTSKAAVKLYLSGYGAQIARMRTEGFEDPEPPRRA